MADVDLSVEVRGVGVTAAIAQVDQLKKQGLDTGAAMQMLGDRFTYAASRANAVSQAVRGTTKDVANQAAVTQTLTGAVRAQVDEYQRLAALSPKLTAFQRLSQNLGTGGLAGGVRSATQIQAYRDSLSADPVRDLITVQRQLAAVEDARATRLASTASLQKANWEAGLAGMNRQQEAQARLTRATQEYATAQAQLRAAPRVTAAARENPEEEARRLRAQAQAIDAVTAARQRLTAAEQEVESANEARLQTSYGYFILAGLATQVATNIYGIGTATLSTSMTIERSFADVERTFEGTDEQLTSLRSKLVELSTTTPNSIVDLAEIATLGNQLGIAAADIENFTSVIAQYTAVSGQSAEDSATAFGRISNLTGLAASQYGNLASAITYTARTTVATESTIQNTAKEISALASGAGFSAQSIVGLAGALSSLAIPPERARGALSLYFGALNSAVAEGGPKLAAFATLTNMSAEALERMVRENRGQEVFTAFISGLSELDTVAKTTALDTLGLSTIRVDQTMRALAQNVPLVTSSFEGANTAFEQGTEIGNQYAIIQDTLNSKWIEFQNAVQNVIGAIGDEFAPAAKDALAVLTGLLEVARQFTDSPIGQAFLRVAGTAAVFIGAIAAGLGIFALARASLVVLSYTVSQMGWTSATQGLAGWVASLLSSDKATRAAALSQTGLRVAISETTGAITAQAVAARAGALALGLLKVALPLIAITAAVAMFDALATSIDKSINPSKTLTEDLTGLRDALIADNPRSVDAAIAGVGTESSAAIAPVSAFNQSILAAIEVQKRAEGQFKDTNSAISEQPIALGEAGKKWIEEALKTQEDLRDIIDGKDAWDRLLDTTPTISREDLEAFIMGGLDLNQLSQIAVEDGQAAAEAAYASWKEGFDKVNPDLVMATNLFGQEALPNILSSVVDAYDKAAVEASLMGTAVEESAGVVVAAAADFDEFGEYVGDAASQGEAFVVTFSGVTGRLDDLRDALQGAIKGYVDFDNVMSRAQDTADAIADAKSKKTGKTVEAAPVNIAQFGTALTDATADATSFFTNIMALVDAGSSSFALQLAELGPEASAILGQALELDASAQAELEASARFAAFLASDAFKSTLEAEMSDSNEAYARILMGGGTLADVQDYIAAQVAGVGAAWEQQWAIDHPDLPLNVTPSLVNPSAEELALYADQLSGAITITPEVAFDYSSGTDPKVDAQRITNTLNGSSVTLTAGVDSAALSASVDIWKQNENATPQELEALLNTDGFNADIDAWRAANGNITVYANVVPVAPRTDWSGILGLAGPTKQQGGLIGQKDVPQYAGGGLVRGPGTNTSDSIWARVSMGERIFAADRERFWGRDFMESLDRKMLPAQIVGMLNAAAVSGNSGGPAANVQVQLINPMTRDPLKQLRESSEMVAAGIWGGDD